VNRLWGEVNGKGQNMLGILLMEVREQLRQEARGAALPWSNRLPKGKNVSWAGPM
jgi:hypothetical protein